MIILKVIVDNGDIRRLTVDEIDYYGLLKTLSDLLSVEREELSVKYLDDEDDKVTIASERDLNEALAVLLETGKNVLRLFVSLSKKSSEKPAGSNTTPTTPSAPGVETLLEMFPQIGQFLGMKEGEVPSVDHLANAFKQFGFNPEACGTTSPGEVPAALADGIQQFLSSNYPFVDVVKMYMAPEEETPDFRGDRTFSGNNSVHRGVTCDGCNQSIVGVRWKCTVCEDFDLCAKCESAGAHNPEHLFLKVVHPLPWGAVRRGPLLPNLYERRAPRPYSRFCRRPCRPQQAAPSQPAEPKETPAVKTTLFARFVEHVSLQNGVVVQPGQNLVKIWKVRNDSEVAWPEHSRLVNAGGDNFKQRDHVEVPALKSKEEVDLAVDLVAPTEPGRYVAFWRFVTPDGQRFGQRLRCDVVVANPSDSDEEISSYFENKVTVEQVEDDGNNTPTLEETDAILEEVTLEETQATEPAGMAVDETQPAEPEVPVQSEVFDDYVRVESPAETAEKDEFQEKLDQIMSMGFDNRDVVEYLLRKYNGDALAVVQDLLRT